MSNEVIFLQKVILSFPHLAEAHSSAPNSPAKYSADFILEKDHPGYAKFMETYGRLAQGKWAEHASQVMQMIQNDRKLRCYGSGDEKVNKKTFQPYDGYAGKVYISANNPNMPQIIRPDGSPVEAGNTMEAQQIVRQMYGGCYVNVALKPWVQDNKHGRGIRCDLVAIQFAADGTPFGEGTPDVSNLFGAAGASAPAASTAPDMPNLPAFLQG